MNCREVQVILVADRRAGLIARRVRRIERQLRQEPHSRRIPGSDLFELRQVGLSDRRIVVRSREMGLVPSSGEAYLRRPTGFASADRPHRLNELTPALTDPDRWWYVCQRM